MNSNTAPPPSIQRHRPIDASGLFWSLVSILAGLFYGRIYSAVYGSLFALSAICGIVFQFKVWSFDSSINRLATEWCRKHYPSYGGTAIVDLMVAIGHNSCCDFHQHLPTTALDVLNRYPDNVMLFVDNRQMLANVVREARIRHVDCSQFKGSTLDDAIRFLIKLDSHYSTATL